MNRRGLFCLVSGSALVVALTVSAPASATPAPTRTATPTSTSSASSAPTTPAPTVTGVSGVKATATDSSVALSWTNSSPTSFARIVARYAAGKKAPATPTDGLAVTTNDPQATSATVTGLRAATTYSFAVWAVDKDGNDSTQSVVTVKTRALPGPAIGLTARSDSDAQITLSWTNPTSPDFAGAKLCRAVGLVAPTSSDCAGTELGLATTYSDSGLTKATVYSYALFAHDASGSYATAATATAETSGDTTAPGPVTQPAARVSGTSVTLTWVDPTDVDFAGVTICRRATGDPAQTADCAPLTKTGPGATSWTDVSATAGAQYVYTLFAHDLVPNYAPGATAAVDVPAAPSAAPASTVSSGPAVQGSVTNSAGVGVAGVSVFVRPVGTGQSSTGGAPSATTTSTGTYSVTAVQAGVQYSVCFDPSTATPLPIGGYLQTCYSHNVAPSASAPTTGVSVQLVNGGAISGTVTAKIGNGGIGGVKVLVFRLAQGVLATDVGSATTASNGSYTMTGIPPQANAYGVCFDASTAVGGSSAAGYFDQCYKNVPWDAGHYPTGRSATVSVSSGAVTTGINVAMLSAGSISGTVSSTSGSGLGGVPVYVYSLLSGQIATPMASAKTAAGGGYTVPGLQPSSAGYGVCFGGGATSGSSSSTGYLSQCYQNNAWSGPGYKAKASAVVVAAGAAVTGINGSLTIGGAISGTVTAASGGGPLADVDVNVFAPDGSYVTDVETAADGTYVATGLASNTTGYTVCFDASEATGGSSLGGYAGACYPSGAWDGESPPSTSVPVPVTVGAISSGINIALASLGGISGTVTAASGGAPVVGASVYILGSNNELAETTTSAKGSYTATGLPASTGGYYVCVDPSAAAGPSRTGYLAACLGSSSWDGGVYESNPPGTPVPVAAGGLATANVTLALAGGLTGTVADPSGHLLADVGVDVFDASGNEVAVQGVSNGTWEVDGLAPGKYRVCFDATLAFGGSSSTGYVSQCYKNQAYSQAGGLPKSATAISVTAGKVGSTLATSLAVAGAVSGVVTAAGSKAALQGVQVYALTSDGTTVASVSTSANGSYVMNGLAPGTAVAICFDASNASGPAVAGYYDQCNQNVSWSGPYGDAGVPAGVTLVTPQAGTTVAVNASLAAAAGIVGTVTYAATGKPVAYANVTLFSSTGTSANSVGFAQAGSDGKYVFQRLQPPTGSGYVVCVEANQPSSGTGTQGQCYNGQAWSGSGLNVAGTPIPLASGQVVTANVALAAGGAISGKATSSAGSHAAVANLQVQIEDASGNTLDYADTSSTGSYLANGLIPGTYYVCYDTYGVSQTGLGYQQYGCVGGGSPGNGATAFTVAAGATTSVAISVATNGGAKGTVTDAGKHPLANVTVYAFPIDGGNSVSVTTSAAGSYLLGGLVPGAAYTLCFDPTNATGGTSAGGYVPQCLGGVTFNPQQTYSPPSGATTFTAVSGSYTVENIALPNAAAIAGTITAASGGAGLAGATVYAMQPNGYSYSAPSATTASDGTYSIKGLTGGSYVICVDGSNATGGPSAGGYQSVCNGNVSWQTSQPVPSAATSTATAVGSASTANLTLAAGASISGAVASADGNPIYNVTIDVYAANSTTLVASATTGYSNAQTYRLGGLPAGPVLVCFDPSTAYSPSSSAGWFRQCWNNTAWPSGSQPAGTTITLAAGTTNTAVNATLVLAGGISGTISGTPSSGGCAYLTVVAFNASGVQSAVNSPSLCAGSSATYQLAGLPAGKYRVCVEVNTYYGNNLAPVCYSTAAWTPAQAPSSSAKSVAVTAGSVTQNVNLAMPAGGTISGTVSAGGSAVSQYRLVVFDSTGQEWAAMRSFSSSWIVDGLPTGSYRVCVDASLSATTAQSGCYSGQSWVPQENGFIYTAPASGATAVKVTTNATTTVNVVLSTTSSGSSARRGTHTR